ncbi:MAG: Gfo/Idh/MocA family oxidoreductase [Oscillospiraceae bacterium]|nr:Gfo/Idh/MocA family oxidoreductase [Oscillospiraceae bacterium]
MDKIKLGFLGLGQRGNGLLSNVLGNFKDVEVVAICDEYEDRAVDCAKRVKDERGNQPAIYTNHSDLLADPNVNTVIISASWEAHIPLAIEAMKQGKITGLEVGGGYSVDDCWQLVRTWEETQTPFMFLENCCYGKAELVATRMVRQGKLGEVCFAHGSYCHDLRKEICDGVKIRHYRLRNYIARNCDNYPTHNLGPIAKILNINRGNRMLKLTSMASKARGLHEYVQGKEEYEFLKDQHFAQGDVVCTNILCADGTMISLKLDTSLPRAYSREFTVSGTKGIFSVPDDVVLTDDMDFNHEVGMERYRGNGEAVYEENMPEIWKSITKEQIEAGHGGMDTLELQAFFGAALSGEEMPIDVYDAASWMVITCLTEASIANGGMPIDIPDFTNGKWVLRKPKDVIPLD